MFRGAEFMNILVLVFYQKIYLGLLNLFILDHKRRFIHDVKSQLTGKKNHTKTIHAI